MTTSAVWRAQKFVPTVAIVDGGWSGASGDSRVAGRVRVFPSGRCIQQAFDVDSDRTGHGTLCGRIILELCPASRIVPIQVLDRNLVGSIEQLVAAIGWCYRYRIDVVCLPLATVVPEHLTYLVEPFERLADAGTICVAAASNANGLGLPACLPSVIGVQAERSNAHVGLRPLFDGGIDYSVCGELDRVGHLFEKTGFSFRSNSFAAAQVAGVSARFMARAGKMTAAEVRSALDQFCLGA